MTKKTAAAANQVMQAEQQLQMERSIEAASIKQLQIIEQQMKMDELKNGILKLIYQSFVDAGFNSQKSRKITDLLSAGKIPNIKILF